MNKLTINQSIFVDQQCISIRNDALIKNAIRLIEQVNIQGACGDINLAVLESLEKMRAQNKVVWNEISKKLY